MAYAESIIEVVDGLLSAIEIRNMPWSSEFKSNEFCTSLSRYEVIRILKNLEKKDLVMNLKVLGTDKKWYEVMNDPLSNDRVIFESDKKLLREYKETLSRGQSYIINPSRKKITQIEVLEDKTGWKRIKIYINADYNNGKEFARKHNWTLMYQLAEDQYVPYEKDFLDYFNSNKNNPLYRNGEYEITKILKQQNKDIVPNIQIELITQKKASQRKLKIA